MIPKTIQSSKSLKSSKKLINEANISKKIKMKLKKEDGNAINYDLVSNRFGEKPH